jgi:hypothetical protein
VIQLNIIRIDDKTSEHVVIAPTHNKPKATVHYLLTIDLTV